MATGIGVVPNGIGTGEAQIINLPSYQRAVFQKEQQRIKSSQEQKLKDAEDLAKMDVNGIHIPDEKIIFDSYKGVTDAYLGYASARTREDRLAHKRLLEDAKADFNFKVATSKERAKKIYSAGERILGMEAGKLTPEQLDYYRQVKESTSFGTSFDETELQPKAKPADMIALKKKIRDNSIDPIATSNYKGKVGDIDVIVTDKGQALYKPIFAENMQFTMEAEPEYADMLERQYGDAYVKSGGDVNNPEALLNFIIDKEFESQRPLSDQRTKSVSQIRDDNNYFSYGQGGATSIDGLTTTKESEDTFTVSETIGTVKGKNEGKVIAKVQIVSPNTIDARINPVSVDITPDVYFDKAGKPVYDSKALLGAKVTGFVGKNVVIDKNGEVVLWPEKTIITNDSGEKREVKTNYKPTGEVKFAVVVRKNSIDPIYVPISEIPLDVLNSKDVKINGKRFFESRGSNSLPKGKKRDGGVNAPAKQKNEAKKYGL